MKQVTMSKIQEKENKKKQDELNNKMSKKTR